MKERKKESEEKQFLVKNLHIRDCTHIHNFIKIKICMQTNFYTPLKYNVIAQPAFSYTIILLGSFSFPFLGMDFLSLSSTTVAVLDIVSEASYDKMKNKDHKH
jgi:hypothetical protein